MPNARNETRAATSISRWRQDTGLSPYRRSEQPRTSTPRLTTRYCKTTATSAPPSPCTSSPRRCHKTSAFPAAAPKDRTDSAPHANRAARRAAAAAHTNRHYQQAAIRSRAGIHSSSPRAVHIQAPHDQNCHSRPRRALDSGRRQCKIEPCSTEGVGTTSASPVTRNGRVSGVSNGPRSIGAAYSRRLARSRRMPSFRAAARRSDRNIGTHRPIGQRIAPGSIDGRNRKRTRSRRRKRGRKGDSSAFRSR